MDQFEEIVLIDPELNRSYPIRLSPADAQRARTDMNFASVLLRYAQSFPPKDKAANVVQKSFGAAPAATTSGIVPTVPTVRTVPTILHSAAHTEKLSATRVVSKVSAINIAPVTATSKTVQTEKESVVTALSTVQATEDGSNDDGPYNWSKAQSRLLITLYGKNEAMFTSGKSSQKQAWEHISMLMAERRHIISGRKCDSKFQSLKRTYKSTRDHNNKSRNSKRTWEYFQDMENIFKKKPWVEPISTAGSDDIDSDDPIAKPKTSKSKQADYLKDLLNFKREQAVKRDAEHNEKLNALADLRDLMREHLNNNT